MKKVLLSQKKRRSPEFGASSSRKQKIFYGTRNDILVNFPSLVGNRLSQHPTPHDLSLCHFASNVSAVFCNSYYHTSLSATCLIILLILLPPYKHLLYSLHLFSLSFPSFPLSSLVLCKPTSFSLHILSCKPTSFILFLLYPHPAAPIFSFPPSFQ